MKLRSALLTFLALFLMGSSLVGATPASLASAPMILAGTTQSCPEGISTTDLPIFALDLQSLSTYSAEYCGACSQSPCKGALRGTPCGPNAINGARCEEYTAPVCTADGLSKCYCYAGDIP